MMRLFKAVMIAQAAAQASQLHNGKPETGVDLCSHLYGMEFSKFCKQGYLTTNDNPFQPLTDPQFSITSETDKYFGSFSCLTLQMLGVMVEEMSNLTTVINDAQNAVMCKASYQFPKEISMTTRVKFFANCALLEDTIRNDEEIKACVMKSIQDTDTWHVNSNYYLLYALGGICIINCCISMCCTQRKNTNTDEEEMIKEEMIKTLKELKIPNDIIDIIGEYRGEPRARKITTIRDVDTKDEDPRELQLLVRERTEEKTPEKRRLQTTLQLLAREGAEDNDPRRLQILVKLTDLAHERTEDEDNDNDNDPEKLRLLASGSSRF